MNREIIEERTAGYGTYFIVWLLLMLLLAATVLLAKLNPFHLAAVSSMIIATLKALLVLLFFMQTIPFVILAIFIVLTFADTYLR
jgi:cytochrome c oxidase subunit IV